jgi:hypothetical protein
MFAGMDRGTGQDGYPSVIVNDLDVHGAGRSVGP